MSVKHFALCAFLLIIGFGAKAQVDSVIIDGNNFYIYPFKQEVKIRDDYWLAIKDKAFFKTPENYFHHFGSTPDFNAESFKNADKKELKYLDKTLASYWKYYRNKGARLGLGPRFVKQVRKCPGPLVAPTYSNSIDVVPPFGNIPDGAYVQLFKDFCLVDEDGFCQEQTERVAAYFNIKDNAIDGRAVWLNLQGDTLKKGVFNNGLKEGSWEVLLPESPYARLHNWSTKTFRKSGVFTHLDTVVIRENYHHGILDGDYLYEEYHGGTKTIGNYSNGLESGNWKTYIDSSLRTNYTYADPQSTITSQNPIIRNTHFIALPNDFTSESRREFWSHARPEIPIGFYSLNFERPLDLELEEELFKSHQLEYSRQYRNPTAPARVKNRQGYRRGFSYFQFGTDPVTKIQETRGYLIDSLGAKMKYDGPYEVYYPNGQLYTRYMFEGGHLAKEDTLFWNNGVPHDVITYVPDSNYYKRTAYTFLGEPYSTLIYDSLGDFSHFVEKPKKVENTEVVIDGLVAKRIKDETFKYFDFDSIAKGNIHYFNRNVLDKPLTKERLLLYKKWSGFDSSVLSETYYDPTTQMLVSTKRSFTGVEFYRSEQTFTDGFESWTGKTTMILGDYAVVTTGSGIANKYIGDSLPQRRMNLMSRSFVTTYDTEIFKNEKRYTGKVKIKNRGIRLHLSQNKLKFTKSNFSEMRRVQRKLYRYITKGKNANDFELSLFNDMSESNSIEYEIYNTFFGKTISSFFSKPLTIIVAMRLDVQTSKRKRTKKVEGAMMNGKPQGEWTWESLHLRKGVY